ncbi:MAG: metalloregulator ArsR/SmtB family transcription factor [Candidatus Poribacteria bacterium]
MNTFSEIMKALSDPIRLRIVHLLLSVEKTPLCVCEIVDALEEQQYAVSRNLGILKHAGLLSESKNGRWVHYSIQASQEPFFLYLYKAISAISDHTLQEDKKRLQERLMLREKGRCLLGAQKTRLLSRKGN